MNSEQNNAESHEDFKSLHYAIVDQINEGLIRKLESLVIEGLKKKGFEFTDENELRDFIKTRCRRVDHVDKKEHVYFVDDTPFFLHKYEIIIETPQERDGAKITANYGRFAFL